MLSTFNIVASKRTDRSPLNPSMFGLFQQKRSVTTGLSTSITIVKEIPVQVYQKEENQLIGHVARQLKALSPSHFLLPMDSLWFFLIMVNFSQESALGSACSNYNSHVWRIYHCMK